ESSSTGCVIDASWILERPPQGGLSVCTCDVRYWPIADICSCAAHVRFWGQSGHAPLVPMQWKVPHGSDIVRLGFELAICVSLAIAGGAHGGKMHSRASRHIPRIGILSPATEPGMRDWWKELTQGLNELGY